MQTVHIGCGATQIRHYTCKTGDFVTHVFHFTNNGIFRTVLNNTAFMLSNRTEATTAKTAAHNIDRKPNHVIGWNFFVTIHRVRHASKGRSKHVIHFLCVQRHGWRINPQGLITMFLIQGPGTAGVGFVMHDSTGVGIHNGISLYHVITG